MPRVITIDPGKSKCGLVLAEISEKKVYEAIILKSELLENYVRNLITAEDISKIIIGNGTTSREIREKLYFFKKEIIFLSLFSISLNNCLSFLVIWSLPSKINRTTSDNLSFLSVSEVINFWVFSWDLDFFFRPPKSIKLIFKSLNFSESSIGKIVVPETSLTLEIFEPAILLKIVDLPTFGLPIIETFKQAIISI